MPKYEFLPTKTEKNYLLEIKSIYLSLHFFVQN